MSVKSTSTLTSNSYGSAYQEYQIKKEVRDGIEKELNGKQNLKLTLMYMATTIKNIFGTKNHIHHGHKK